MGFVRMIFGFSLLLVAYVSAVDFYKALNITRFANTADIKKAFRAASLLYHPDKYRGDPAEAQEKMIVLNEANRVLMNPKLRKMYEYYEEDYEDMVQYEEHLQENRAKDLYLYDSSIWILWQRNMKSLMLNNTGITWVVNLYSPHDPDCIRQVSAYQTFGRMAQKTDNIRAASLNCESQGNLCMQFFRMMGKRQVPSIMIFSSLQPDENQLSDFEVFDGHPSPKELMRSVQKVANHEVVAIDGNFLTANITRNPYVKESNRTAISLWCVWFYHSKRCARVDECDRLSTMVRRMSAELKGLARFAAINCADHQRACRSAGFGNDNTSLRMFVQRGSNHFVEAFDLRSSSAEDTALSGASAILRFIAKPSIEIFYPPHPFRKVVDEGPIDLKTANIKKLKIAQLKDIIAQHGEQCVGCSDKSDFVKLVTEIRDRKTEL